MSLETQSSNSRLIQQHRTMANAVTRLKARRIQCVQLLQDDRRSSCRAAIFKPPCPHSRKITLGEVQP